MTGWLAVFLMIAWTGLVGYLIVVNADAPAHTYTCEQTRYVVGATCTR